MSAEAGVYSCGKPCDCTDPVDHAIRGKVDLDGTRVMLDGMSPQGRSIYREIVEMYSRAAEISHEPFEVRCHMQAMLNRCDPETLTRYRAVVDEGLRVLSQAGIASSLALMEVFLWF